MEGNLLGWFQCDLCGWFLRQSAWMVSKNCMVWQAICLDGCKVLDGFKAICLDNLKLGWL